MTGNVDGGKHFRGYLPYNSTSDLTIDVGSSYIDAFMRYTQVPTGTDITVSGYSPFYSQTASVTGMVPGQGYVINPGLSMPGIGPELRQLGQSDRTLITMDDISLLGNSADKIDLKGLPLLKEGSSEEDREVITQDLPLQGLDIPEADQRTESWTELNPLKKEAPEVSEDLSLFKKPGVQEPGDLNSQSRVVQIQTFPEEDTDDGTVGIRDDLDLLGPISDPTLSVREETDRWQEAVQDVNEDGNAWDTAMMDLWKNITVHTGDKDTAPEPSEDVALHLQIPPSVQNELCARMKGSSQYFDQASFTNYSQRQFCKYVNEAEYHLRSGDTRRALNAYTMASVYYPDDPLVDLGKSHALFAQGEFAGSALFLSRALEGLPAYGKVRLDLAGLLGGEQRLAEYIKQAETELRESPSVDLYIVLGYIYYQIGDLDSARGAIETARESRPDCPAVKVMREVIQDAYDAL
jgi:tetratricopeptide (TPR) repeat protein